MSAPNTPSLTRILHAVFLSPPSGLDSETMASLLGKPYATLMSELSGQPGHKLGALRYARQCLGVGGRQIRQ
ncbi:MAG: hypothetical protein LBP55_07520 [Candidatus Adiutrix sp.]|jgi:hypothetical protein|nr:hypothetical protein [Candidatus Adiutrix sp.]